MAHCDQSMAYLTDLDSSIYNLQKRFKLAVYFAHGTRHKARGARVLLYAVPQLYLQTVIHTIQKANSDSF